MLQNMFLMLYNKWYIMANVIIELIETAEVIEN